MAVRVGVLVSGIGPSYYISRIVRQQMGAFRRAGGREERWRGSGQHFRQSREKFPYSLIAHFSLHGHQKPRTAFMSIFREVIEYPSAIRGDGGKKKPLN